MPQSFSRKQVVTESQLWTLLSIMFCRCFLPIAGQPLLTASHRRGERPLNEPLAWRLPSWVCRSVMLSRDRCINTMSLPMQSFLLSTALQNVSRRWDGGPDAGRLRLGEHVLHHWHSLRSLGTRCLAVFPERYASILSLKIFS